MRKYFLQHDHNLCELAIKLYQSGLSIWAVGKKIGYGGQAVNKLLKDRGIDRRHGIKPEGATYLKKGRVKVKTNEGWKSRSRITAARQFGEEAIKGRDIHHKNRNTQDDQPENLEPLTRSEHCATTNRQRRKP